MGIRPHPSARTRLVATLRPSQRGAAVVPPFVPANLLQWLRADTGVDAIDGALVPSWADRSTNGNNVTQADVTHQFTFAVAGGPNATPCLVAGGNQWLQGPSLTPASASVYIVAQVEGDAGLVSFGFSRYLYVHSGVNVGFGSVGGGVNTGGYTDGSWLALEFHVDGSTLDLVLNGVVSSAACSDVWVPQFLGMYDNNGQINIPLTGAIAELVVCSPVLATLDRAAVSAYLTGRYGAF